MKKPYIICHMETSINSKIYGPYMQTDLAATMHRHYDECHAQFNSEAWLVGRVTMQHFSGTDAPIFNPDAPRYPREDFVAPTDLGQFVVSIDPSGRLAWQKNSIQYNLRPEAHLIEVLTDKVSDDYVAYLRERQISYVFAGAEVLDLTLAVHKLYTLFGIETLVVSGGALVNGSFLNTGLIDEVSLVVAPIVDDAITTPTFFQRSESLPERPPIQFAIHRLQALDDDHYWIRYVAKTV